MLGCGARSSSPASSAFPACWPGLSCCKLVATEAKTKPPVLLVHGDADEMLPHTLTQRAAQALTAAGIETRLHISEGIGHTIDETGLQLAARFLLNVFELPEPQ